MPERQGTDTGGRPVNLSSSILVYQHTVKKKPGEATKIQSILAGCARVGPVFAGLFSSVGSIGFLFPDIWSTPLRQLSVALAKRALEGKARQGGGT